MNRMRKEGELETAAPRLTRAAAIILAGALTGWLGHAAGWGIWASTAAVLACEFVLGVIALLL